MSIKEIKREAQSLTPLERTELRAYLRLLDIKDDPVRQKELADSLERARAGNTITAEELKELITRS